MVAPCEWAHHVVEDDRYAVVQKRLAEHQEVEVGVHTHLNTEVVIIKSTKGRRQHIDKSIRLYEIESVFLNVYGSQELIPRNEFRQPM